MKSPTTLFNSWILLAGMCFGQSAQAPDSSQTDFPDKLKSRPAWEYWLSTPFWLAASPWIILNKGIEKSIGYIDDHKIVPAVKRVLISKDETRIIMPTHSSPIGSGVRYLKKDLASQGSELNIVGTYGQAHRHSISADWQEMRLSNSAWYLGATFGYHYKSDEDWYGEADSDESRESEYGIRQVYGNILFKRKLGKHFSIDMLGGADYSRVEDPGSDDPYVTQYHHPNNLLGLQDQIILGQGVLRLTFDNTNRKGNPTRGWEVALNTGAYPQLNNTDFGYFKTSLDIRKYIHLFHRRTLALRVEGQVMREIVDRYIPFYALSELGTKETIRGFERGRFHDRDRLIATVEYRYPIWIPRWHAIETVLFADAGQIMNDASTQFADADIHYGIGGGLRFYSEENLIARIEVARSKEQWRFYFVLN